MVKLAWRFITSRRFRSLSGVVSILLGTTLLAALLTLGRSLQVALDQAMAPEYSALRENINSMRSLAYGLGIAALLAAAFLLSASFRIALTERRRELALLRTIGAAPAQVRQLVLVEGVLLGGVGSILGVSIGLGGALLSARAAATILGVQPGPVVVPWGPLAAVAFAGVLLTLFSAWRVAQAAGRTAPLEALRPDLAAQTQEARQGGRFGLVLVAAGVAAYAVTPLVSDKTWDGGFRALVGAFGGLAIGLGLLLAIPRLLPLLLPVLTYPWRHRQEAPLAVRSLLRHRRRSGLTVGATALGLIMVVAVGTFSATLLERWSMDVVSQHPADLEVVPYVHPGRFPTELVDQVAQIPGITRAVSLLDGQQALLTDYDRSRFDPAYLAKLDALEAQLRSPLSPPSSMPAQWEYLPLSPASPVDLAQVGAIRVTAGSLANWDDNALALSQKRAEGMHLKVGDQLTLNVNQAIPPKAKASPELRTYTITALFAADVYGFPEALIAHPLPGVIPSLHMLFGAVAPGQIDVVRPQIQRLLNRPEYRNANFSDREQALADFRTQTYQRLVLVLAVGLVMAAVAAMSLLNTMAGSVSERRREFALLRSVGATPKQVRNLVLLESALLGLVGGLVGVVGGATLGSGALFGLTLPLNELRLPWLLMAGGLGVALLLALVAAGGPASQVMHRLPAEVLRQE